MFWTLNRPIEDEDIADQVFLAELSVLRSEPRTAEQASRLIEVLVAQSGIERGDGADIAALKNLQRLMSKLAGVRSQDHQEQPTRRAA